MSKHTPAPWRTLGNWAVVTKTKTIADLYKSNADCDELDEIEANARLIAAAPDLLEALKDLVDAIPTETWEVLPQYIQEQAINAVNQAEGK